MMEITAVGQNEDKRMNRNEGCLRDFCDNTKHTNTCIAAAAKSLESCLALQPHRRQPTRLPHPWDSPGKNAAVGCHFLLQ